MSSSSTPQDPTTSTEATTDATTGIKRTVSTTTPEKEDAADSLTENEATSQEENQCRKKLKPSCSDQPLQASTTSATAATSTTTDVALDLGYQAGDAIQVQWSIFDQEDDNNNTNKDDDQDDQEEEGQSHWWNATLLPATGRLTQDQQQVIRTLEYVALPEQGFPEASREDVVFLNDQQLMDPQTKQILYYRPARDDDNELAEEDDDQVLELDHEGVETIVNSILSSLLEKKQAQFQTLTPAQQATIAASVASKKQRLVQLLLEQRGGETVTRETMQAILAQTMQE